GSDPILRRRSRFLFAGFFTAWYIETAIVGAGGRRYGTKLSQYGYVDDVEVKRRRFCLYISHRAREQKWRTIEKKGGA
ncbi:unnamed protein product, partial [Brassica oleracea var. botrytis]